MLELNVQGQPYPLCHIIYVDAYLSIVLRVLLYNLKKMDSNNNNNKKGYGYFYMFFRR